ncbi:MAG: F0F1 ATP synthase subunit A [Acidimicrobiales bacterium]|jgi:F-type H+-transporting ATPase subunit a
MTGVIHLLASDINVGTHVQRDGLDLDTIWSTVVAMIIVIAMGLYLRAKATSGVPGKLQLTWEMGVDAVRTQVEGTIGPRGAAVVPLAVTLFVFILVANWFSVLGIGSEIEWIAPPTSDINVTLALALIVIIPVHIASIRARGVVGYVRHYVSQPFPKALFPVNIFINGVEEIAKPLTLALRLFGNLLSGGLMLALIAALGVWSISHVPIGDVATIILNPVWKVFDLFIGAIQAFIFALLTILYFDSAMSEAH